MLAVPNTVTTTLPVVAPTGTVTVMLVALQTLAAAAAVPLKVTVLVPCGVPKLVPVMVIDAPTAPEVRLRLVMVGGRTIVNGNPLLATPNTVTTTLPVVAPAGTNTVMLVALQALAAAAVFPLKVTVLDPCAVPKLVPVMVIDAPTAPAFWLRLVMVGGGGRLMRILKACVAVCAGLLESVTITVKFDVTLGASGVPEISPALLRVKPDGSAPALVVNVSVPNPVAATILLYAVPATPGGSVVVVMVGAGGKSTRILRAWVAVIGVMVLESVTLTVKFTVPLGPAGVPEIVPAPLRVKPVGNAPALMENVTVPAPPVFAIAWLYAVPSVPGGSVVVVIAGGAVTVIVSVDIFVVSVTEVAVITAVPEALPAL